MSHATNWHLSHSQDTKLTVMHDTQVTQYFPKAANSTSFKWKDYCPVVFHNLREAFSIDNKDYLLSLTGDR